MIFYDEMAESFNQEVHNAGQHPIIVIISSSKARLIQGSPQIYTLLFFNTFIDHCQLNVLGEPKLTNYLATRFFINLHHEAVQDLRDAFRLAVQDLM